MRQRRSPPLVAPSLEDASNCKQLPPRLFHMSPHRKSVSRVHSSAPLVRRVGDKVECVLPGDKAEQDNWFCKPESTKLRRGETYNCRGLHTCACRPRLSARKKMDMIRGDMIRGLVGQENCPSIGHDSWLGDKAQGVIVTVVEQAGHLKKWKRSSCGVWAFWARLTSLLKESVWRRQQVVVERIAIACRLQLFVSLCGGIIKVKENTKIPRLPHAQTPEKALHTSP